jgi:PAS domain S-box-containing protein
MSWREEPIVFHDVINEAAYMPHGYCLLWQPWLITMHAGSDILIFLAYSAIPLAIWIFLDKRRDVELRSLAILFCAFIFLCGLTHLIEAITLWRPIYQFQAFAKLATALVSITTAILIFPLIPQALAIPSPAQLKRVNDGLEQEAASHRLTLQQLEQAKSELEARVAERTCELEAAKARFETLVQASAEVVWTAQANGEASGDSPSWRLFTGQTYDEYKGWGWFDAIHPDDRPKVLATWKEALASGKRFVAEYRIQHVSGGWRWTIARATPLVASAGSALEWVGMNTDISERKNADLAVRLQADQYAAILAASTDGFMLLDRHACLLDVNDAYCRMSGYSREDLLNSKFSDLEAVRTEIELSEHIEQIIFDGYDYFETQHHRKDGQILYIECSAAYWGAMGQIICFIRDITQRKRAEQALQESEEGLREAQRIAGIGSWELDLLTGSLRWSEGLSRIMGRDPSLPPPSFADFLSCAHPDDRKTLEDSIQELSHTGKPAHLEYRIIRADGELRSVEARGRRYEDSQGLPIRLAGTVHDITERKRVQDELREHQEHLEVLVDNRTQQLANANEKLKLANGEMEAFSYSVSHDLRVPLRAIDGFSHALLEDYGDKLDADGARLLNVVHDNTAKMGRLIDDILSFSRVGRAELTEGVVDMAASVQSVLTDLEPTLRNRTVRFRVGALPSAQGDATMMQRVWANLIENAVKYSGKKPEADIEIGAEAQDKETIYYVKDNGAGFDMQYADKLFGVFQRLHTSEFNGTGIGLAIVKRIVTRHSGRVWAEGRPNEGAAFYFALPNKDICNENRDDFEEHQGALKGNQA